MKGPTTLVAGTLLLAGLGAADPYTPKHEAGRCSMRDHCGTKSWFGKQLPCADNGLAEEPEDDVRKQLVELCGPKWRTGPVCCTPGQVRPLSPSIPRRIVLTKLLCRSSRSSPSCRPRTRSSLRAPPARTTSSTFSAPLLARPTSPSSSTSPTRWRRRARRW